MESDRARQAYLEAQVMTATPQKLRLMLIDAALQAARQTLDHWQREENQPAFETLVRCRELVAELLSGVAPEKTDLTRHVTALYVFILQSLNEVRARRDPQRLAELIGILEIEQQTWRQVCEQMPAAPPGWTARQTRPPEITASSQLPGPHGGGPAAPARDQFDMSH